MADAHEVGGISLLLNIEILDEEEANNAIATGAVGRVDNSEVNGPVSVMWSLREHWTWEGKKIRPETNGAIDEITDAIAGTVSAPSVPHAAVRKLLDRFYDVLSE